MLPFNSASSIYRQNINPSSVVAINKLTSPKEKSTLKGMVLKDNPSQFERLQTILKTKFEIKPTHDSLDIVQFTIPEIIQYLTKAFKEAKLNHAIPEISGGAVCNILTNLYKADVDINIQIYHQDFDAIFKILIQFVESKIKKPCHIPSTYFTNKVVCPEKSDFSFFGLGDLDLKFIFNKNKRWHVSTSDQFFIPLAEPYTAYCTKGNLKEPYEALLHREFIVNAYDDVDDLILRYLHKITQGFLLPEKNSDIFITMMLVKAMGTYWKSRKDSNAFQKKYAKYLKKHYPSDNEIGKMLNFLNFLMLIQKISNEEARQFFTISLINAWKQQNSPFLSVFIKLCESEISLIPDFLNVLKGLYLIEWCKSKDQISGYPTNFSRDPKNPTPRKYFAFHHNKEYPHFLNIETGIETIVKNYLTSLKFLENRFESIQKAETTFKSKKDLRLLKYLESYYEKPSLFQQFGSDMGIKHASVIKSEHVNNIKCLITMFDQGKHTASTALHPHITNREVLYNLLRTELTTFEEGKKYIDLLDVKINKAILSKFIDSKIFDSDKELLELVNAALEVLKKQEPSKESIEDYLNKFKAVLKSQKSLKCIRSDHKLSKVLYENCKIIFSKITPYLKISTFQNAQNLINQLAILDFFEADKLSNLSLTLLKAWQSALNDGSIVAKSIFETYAKTLEEYSKNSNYLSATITLITSYTTPTNNVSLFSEAQKIIFICQKNGLLTKQEIFNLIKTLAITWKASLKPQIPENVIAFFKFIHQINQWSNQSEELRNFIKEQREVLIDLMLPSAKYASDSKKVETGFYCLSGALYNPNLNSEIAREIYSALATILLKDNFSDHYLMAAKVGIQLYQKLEINKEESTLILKIADYLCFKSSASDDAPAKIQVGNQLLNLLIKQSKNHEELSAYLMSNFTSRIIKNTSLIKIENNLKKLTELFGKLNNTSEDQLRILREISKGIQSDYSKSLEVFFTFITEISPEKAYEICTLPIIKKYLKENYNKKIISLIDRLLKLDSAIATEHAYTLWKLVTEDDAFECSLEFCKISLDLMYSSLHYNNAEIADACTESIFVKISETLKFPNTNPFSNKLVLEISNAFEVFLQKLYFTETPNSKNFLIEVIKVAYSGKWVTLDFCQTMLTQMLQDSIDSKQLPPNNILETFYFFMHSNVIDEDNENTVVEKIKDLFAIALKENTEKSIEFIWKQMFSLLQSIKFDKLIDSLKLIIETQNLNTKKNSSSYCKEFYKCIEFIVQHDNLSLIHHTLISKIFNFCIYSDKHSLCKQIWQYALTLSDIECFNLSSSFLSICTDISDKNIYNLVQKLLFDGPSNKFTITEATDTLENEPIIDPKFEIVANENVSANKHDPTATSFVQFFTNYFRFLKSIWLKEKPSKFRSQIEKTFEHHWLLACNWLINNDQLNLGIKLKVELFNLFTSHYSEKFFLNAIALMSRKHDPIDANLEMLIQILQIYADLPQNEQSFEITKSLFDLLSETSDLSAVNFKDQSVIDQYAAVLIFQAHDEQFARIFLIIRKLLSHQIQNKSLEIAYCILINVHISLAFRKKVVLTHSNPLDHILDISTIIHSDNFIDAQISLYQALIKIPNKHWFIKPLETYMFRLLDDSSWKKYCSKIKSNILDPFSVRVATSSNADQLLVEMNNILACFYYCNHDFFGPKMIVKIFLQSINFSPAYFGKMNELMLLAYDTGLYSIPLNEAQKGTIGQDLLKMSLLRIEASMCILKTFNLLENSDLENNLFIALYHIQKILKLMPNPNDDRLYSIANVHFNDQLQLLFDKLLIYSLKTSSFKYIEQFLDALLQLSDSSDYDLNKQNASRNAKATGLLIKKMLSRVFLLKSVLNYICTYCSVPNKNVSLIRSWKKINLNSTNWDPFNKVISAKFSLGKKIDLKKEENLKIVLSSLFTCIDDTSFIQEIAQLLNFINSDEEALKIFSTENLDNINMILYKWLDKLNKKASTDVQNKNFIGLVTCLAVNKFDNIIPCLSEDASKELLAFKDRLIALTTSHVPNFNKILDFANASKMKNISPSILQHACLNYYTFLSQTTPITVSSSISVPSTKSLSIDYKTL